MGNARLATLELQRRLNAAGIAADFDAAETLRRAQLTLHRWGELECGDGDNYKSWAIERDEATGKPYMVVYPHDGKPRRYRVADREAWALRRIAAVCKAAGVHYFHQTDPRGCALYVAAEPLTESDYTRGVACCV